MKIIAQTTEFMLNQNSAVTIGKFDGIHVGHCRLLQKITEQKARGLLAVVFTFDPSPAALFGEKQLELTTREEKREVFEKMGIDVLVEFPLSRKTAAIKPEEFVSQILVKQMKAKYIAAGTDLSFGDKGAGDFKLLQQMCKKFDYQVEIIDKVTYDDKEVSSSLVREEVTKGNMITVQQLLGHAYTVSGTIVTGNRIGRTLGMPTVNLLPGAEKLMPPFGVYYSRVFLQDTPEDEKREYCGITNIGYKPTVSQEKILGVETYLYHFTGDLYGRNITVELLEFKRGEQQFASLDALKKQLMLDVEDGRKYHKLQKDCI